ncbi:MAG: MBL fold metallo-hydrolase [Lachnospiraceae bacterium]|nr:MBL fold metallo-hydrolase [Lachnospiraceae bacterium]
MVNILQILPDIYWTGANDRRISRFENLFPLPNGVSYNCYLVLDDKTALMDTMDNGVNDQFMENVMHGLNGRKLDYLVLHHMEPDHCSQIQNILDVFPEVVLVGNAQTFKLLDQFYVTPVEYKKEIVKDGDVLDTGHHKFVHYMTPMMHWPEVFMSYDEATGALFSADVFGTFGAVDSGIYADECDFERIYLDDSRRYYANIVGKYGDQSQAGMKKLSGLDIKMLCPLHGPVWRTNIDYIMDKYQKWTTYTPEEEGYVVVYGTMYGNTASAAAAAATKIQAKSKKPVVVYDVSETHPSYIVSAIWRFSNVVLICPTYNGGLFMPMETLINDLKALGIRNRHFFLAENGSWGPAAGRLMKTQLESFRDCTVMEDIFTIKGALHAYDEERLQAWTDSICG